ncbi:iron-sulfur cluster carrier protein ApbC [Psychromonas sp. MB-3u-54]|uniref:iron-sulfur cluster carrier protein ApbC n=1 Tax=Psychromonas sp. MB-3u-54 TaxID=2058319 RepID=UPI000C33C29F|nr:iron-sulfur cluster carrier protein ApbC [Psychromonas sp. MB-3u-54]PKH03822.1 iron-sulfur cluster carrier protein ApbC [Psychromonas sp. MB-3u-54]
MFFNKKSLSDKVTACLQENDPTKVVAKLMANKAILIDEKSATIKIVMPFYAPAWLHNLQLDCTAKLEKLFGKSVSWKVNHQVASLQNDTTKSALPNIKNIIVVASGKGGVGKSTVSVNLALALAENGAQVGILDADIYGPSIPTMLGVKGAEPVSVDGKLMSPIKAHGIVCNSIGFLVAEEDAMIWRGPMASKALSQVLNETDWQGLDYLVVDMPPGTGDIQLTMSQNVPVTAAVVVTTPQDVALIDAKKGISMFNKVAVNVAGIIENMSLYSCSQCGHEEAIFGTGGGKKLAKQFNLPFLGALPLHIKYREDTDQGMPTVIKGDSEVLSAPFLSLAETLSINLYRDLTIALPEITITNLG